MLKVSIICIGACAAAAECATTHAASSSFANYGRCETTLNYGKLIMKVNTNDADQDSQIEKDDVMQHSTSQIKQEQSANIFWAKLRLALPLFG